MDNKGLSALVGAWGYLSGDEDNGYWIANEAVRLLFKEADGRVEQASILGGMILRFADYHDVWEMLEWRHQSASPCDIAKMACLVLEAAGRSDTLALWLVEQAATELLTLLATRQRKLNMVDAPLAFAGGLLQNESPLSIRLIQRLELDCLPQPLYPPNNGSHNPRKEGARKCLILY